MNLRVMKAKEIEELALRAMLEVVEKSTVHKVCVEFDLV